MVLSVAGGTVTVLVNGAPQIAGDALVTDIVLNGLGGADTFHTRCCGSTFHTLSSAVTLSGD